VKLFCDKEFPEVRSDASMIGMLFYLDGISKAIFLCLVGYCILYSNKELDGVTVLHTHGQIAEVEGVLIWFLIGYLVNEMGEYLAEKSFWEYLNQVTHLMTVCEWNGLQLFVFLCVFISTDIFVSLITFYILGLLELL
jgi:hypothetical protein